MKTICFMEIGAKGRRDGRLKRAGGNIFSPITIPIVAPVSFRVSPVPVWLESAAADRAGPEGHRARLAGPTEPAELKGPRARGEALFWD